MSTVLLVDVDGTLVNSWPGVRQTLEKTFEEIDWPMPSEDIIARLPGPPLGVTFASYGMSGEYLTHALEVFRHYYTESGWRNASLFPGWKEVLPQWKAAGYSINTATSKSIGHTKSIIENLGVRPYFDFLGASGDDGSRGTKAEVIEYVLESQNLDPARDRILMIGDRSHDIEGAAEFAIPTALVGWGHGNQAEWDSADFFARDFKDLERIVRDFAR